MNPLLNLGNLKGCITILVTDMGSSRANRGSGCEKKTEHNNSALFCIKMYNKKALVAKTN